MSEITHRPPRNKRRWRRTAGLVTLLGLFTQAQWLALAATQQPTAAAADPARGKPVYVLCAGCHGDQGEGIEPYGAPRLSHLQDWYLQKQLQDFREFKRGGDAADPMGQRMQLIAAAVKDPATLADVVAYIGTLPAVAQPAVDEARIEAGAKVYAASCVACHGPAAEGNPALHAPRLAGGNAWYLQHQLEKFRSGLRGKNDPVAASMAAMAQALKGPKDVADVAAYLSSLTSKP